MSLETGKIYDGKVRNIAPYGAFVEVNLDGKVHTGMVHISEISNTYVNEIRDHLTEGQEVKVKVLNVDENGKISLSIKKVDEDNKPKSAPREALTAMETTVSAKRVLHRQTVSQSQKNLRHLKALLKRCSQSSSRAVKKK